MIPEIKLRNGNVLEIGEIPEWHKIEFLANSLEGKFFYVVNAPHVTEETIDKFSDYYGSFGLHMGTLNEMREADVGEVIRWRDGGSTQINYVLEGKRGQLCFPSPRNKGAVTSNTFNGKTTELKILIEGEDF